MLNILLEFFAINKKIAIPGIGTLSVQTLPAEDNFGKRIITASKENIVFTKEIGTQLLNDFEFYVQNHFQKTGQDVQQYFHQLTNTLQNENRLNLDGLGIFEKKDKIISFHAIYTSENFFPPVSAEKVIRHDAEHTIRVGEDEKTNTQMREALSKQDSKKYWWIYVLIVLLIGGAAYYFYTLYFQK